MLPLWTSVTERRPLARAQTQGGAYQPLGPFLRDRLDPDGGAGREPDLGELGRIGLGQPGFEGPGAIAARFELDPGVQVLRVLAEDDHVDVLRALHRRRHALEVAHRPLADVQVERLAQSDVERPDSAADGCRQRALDPHQEFAEGLDRFVRQPGLEAVERLLSGEDLHPGDAPLAVIGFVHGGVEDPHGSAPDVGAGAIALDEGQDRAQRDHQPPVIEADRLALRRNPGRGIRHVRLLAYGG